MQPDSSTKHIARVKPSQFIEQHYVNRQTRVTAAVAEVIRLTTRATPMLESLYCKLYCKLYCINYDSLLAWLFADM